MAQAFDQDWNRGKKSGLVSIGSHSLYLSVSGPDRVTDKPIVILMTGSGSTISEWVVVERLLQPFYRFLCYDRSGLGKSDSPPIPPKTITAVSVAGELDILLRKVNIAGPYIILCHSWGGITAREFLHLRGDEVVGMVFVDACQEKTFLHHENFPPPCFQIMMQGLDYYEATGIKADTVLSQEEIQAVLEILEKPETGVIEAAEDAGAKGDWGILAAKKQLEHQIMGNRPISVIHGNTARDFQRVLEAGVEAGNGSEEDREEFKEMVEWWRESSLLRSREILSISRVGRWRHTERSGHNVQLIEPELIVEEVEWVWNKLIKITGQD